MLASLISFFRPNQLKLYPDDLKATLGYHERMNRGQITPVQAEVEALRKYVKELEFQSLPEGDFIEYETA